MAKKKVLVVDDEKDFLEITKLNLEDTGKFEVSTLSEGRFVISTLHNFNPDVILLDIMMPKMGGLEICKALNEDEIGRRVPILILSALNTDQDKLKAYKLGIVDYLAKPIEKDELIAKIEKALQFK